MPERGVGASGACNDERDDLLSAVIRAINACSKRDELYQVSVVVYIRKFDVDGLPTRRGSKLLAAVRVKWVVNIT